MRFDFIEKLCEKTVVKPAESREHKRSVAIDRILTGKYTAIPCFVGIMAFVFVMTFNYLGAWLSDGMTMAVDWVIALIGKGLAAAGVSSVLQSLVVDGILSGIGSVIGFLPTIVTLFSSCQFWKIPDIWPGWLLLWTNFFERSDFPEEVLCRC